MTIREFKEIIKDFPDDLQIGGIGHFGELLDINSVEYKDDKHSLPPRPFIGMRIDSAGEEPD